MPRPQNVEDAQRLNGIVNYLAKFLPRLTEAMEPIRRLTRKDTDTVLIPTGSGPQTKKEHSLK